MDSEDDGEHDSDDDGDVEHNGDDDGDGVDDDGDGLMAKMMMVMVTMIFNLIS